MVGVDQERIIPEQNGETGKIFLPTTFLHHAMIAPGLGIEPEKLTREQNPAGGTFGYKFSPTMEALLDAAAMATGQANKAACELLLGAMRKSDGSFRTYDEMKQENISLEYTGSWAAPATNYDENAQGNPFAAYMYGVFMAEVCVEPATGKTKVNRMTAVADIGKIINRLTVDGQM